MSSKNGNFLVLTDPYVPGRERVSLQVEFLILVHTGPTFSGGAAVLRIYRRRDHPGDPIREGPDHGNFIREIALKEIRTPDKVAAMSSIWTDHTPECHRLQPVKS